MYLTLYLRICAKKRECATRLSSSGLPSLGDPCRPRWERGPCRSRGAALRCRQCRTTNQTSRTRGKGEDEEEYLGWRTFEVKARAWNMLLPEIWTRLKGDFCALIDLTRWAEWHRWQDYIVSYFLNFLFLFRFWPPQCNAWVFVRQSW